MTRAPRGEQREGTGWYRIRVQANDRADKRQRTEGKSWYRIHALASGTAGPTRIDLYDEIGMWGITDQEFLADLQRISGPVELHINSPGGDVFQGANIYNNLMSRTGVTTVVDGIAASAAALILLAGEERLGNELSQVMIHDAWAGIDGDAAAMAAMGARLETTSQQMAQALVRTAGGTADDWRTLMRATTYYTADQALESGILTGVIVSSRGQVPVPAAASIRRQDGQIAAGLRPDGAAAPASVPPGPVQGGVRETPAEDGQDGTGDQPGDGPEGPSSAAVAPAPSEGEQGMPEDQGALTIEARRTRIDEISSRMTEIAAAHPSSMFPPALQAEWISIVAERDGHFDALDAVEARNADIAAGLARRAGAGRTDGALDDTGRPQAQANGRRQAPAFIPHHDVFNMGAIRQQASSPEDLPALFRDGAMRAIEGFRFPGAPNRETAQANMARLVSTVRDDTTAVVAQRILRTGSPAYVRAFGRALARGNPGALTGDDAKVLALGESDSGSYAVPVELDPSLNLTSNGAINSIRQISRVVQITGREYDLVNTTGVVVTRKAEFAVESDNSPVLTQPTVKAEKISAFVPFSVEIEGDWTGLQAEMSMLIADAKDVEEAHAYTLGTGVAPDAGGVITTADSASFVASTGGSGALSIDDPETLIAAMPPRFRAMASFMASKTTYVAYRKLFGGQAGYATDPWNKPSLGQPSTLWGFNDYEASDMAATHATGDKPLILGDFGRGYLIVDRVGMNMELVPHLMQQAVAGTGTGRPTGQRGYYVWWRNNAMVLIPNAFRLIQVQ